MKNILLIDPAYIVNYTLSNKEFSVGLITIGGYVKRNSQNLFEIDYFMPENKTNIMGFEEWLRYVKNTIINYHPDIIGCTTRCDTYPFTLEFLQEIKSVLPQTLIILGGAQATHTDLQTMNLYPSIDFIVRGEGEITFLELLMYIHGMKDIQEILGITYRADDKSIIRSGERDVMKNLETFPDYQTIFTKNDKVLINRIEAGRGCPYNCIFCSLCKMWKRKFRLLDGEQIIKKMDEVHSINGCTYFALEHDNLFADKQSAEKLLCRLAELEKHYLWACSSRIDSIRNIDISLLKEAGCKNIFFGIETGSPKMQTIYNKNIELTIVYDTLLMLNNYGIDFTLSFVCGHPCETAEDIEKTINLCIQCKTLTHCTGIQIHKLSPLAGSILFEEVKETVYLDDNSISDQSNSFLYQKYKKIISKNPSVFSSFFSIPLSDKSMTLLSSILTNGIDIINYFSRTLYFIIDNELMQLSELLLYFQDINDLLCKIGDMCNSSTECTLGNIYNFEMAIYKCHVRYNSVNLSTEIKEQIIYNSSQIIVESYDYIIDFKTSNYRNNLKKEKKVKVRIWADYRTSTIRFSLFDDVQSKNMELCRNILIVNRMSKSTITKLIEDGFLMEGGTS